MLLAFALVTKSRLEYLSVINPKITENIEKVILDKLICVYLSTTINNKKYKSIKIIVSEFTEQECIVNTVLINKFNPVKGKTTVLLESIDRN